MITDLHIIAEAGTNHGGRLPTAIRLADVAAQAGADSVKFQIIYPDGLYLPRICRDGHTSRNDVFEQRRAGSMVDDDYRRLASHCKDADVPMAASIFDQRGLDLLCELDSPFIKIASCDLNYSGLLRAVAERGRKMIVSTGMSSLGEIEKAIEEIFAAGHQDVVLMHCVSVYPCPVELMNLSFIDTLKTAFGLPVGISDHTESSVAGAAAIAKGATWVEKHVTLDRSAQGFDHVYAMEPTPFRDYVQDLRAVAAACAKPQNKVSQSEAEVRQRARRSLYAARDLEEGDILREDDVLIVRPEGRFAPDDLPLILGRRLARAVHAFEELSPSVLALEE